ncbi:MAG: extracellular solute-binding protein [Ruminococcaceae bacterium]|nr:extracellular solute-binding protein [Oscillospiraceae bacterium]
MKKRIVKSLSLLMAVCLLLGSFSLASCSAPDEEVETTTGESNTEADTEVDPRATLDTPDVNYNGYTFRVSSIASDTHYTTLDPGKLSGEAVNDALYERNRKIEDEYGIVFECVSTDITSNYSLLEKQVMAGSGDDYDLIMQISRNAFSAAIQNLLINYNQLTYVDTDKNYYFDDINKQFTIGKNTFFAYGYDNINVFSLSSALFFNKTIVNEMNMGNLYEDVRNKTWTFDRLYTLATEAASDGNGDGEFKLGEDVLGLIGNYDRTIPCFWVTSGEKLITKDADDLPVYTANGNERMINIMQEAAAYFATDAFDVYGADTNRLSAFMDGKALFLSTGIGELSKLKSVELDYGVLPWPMYDQNQQDYVSRCGDAWLHCVPSNAKDPERTSIIMQALAYYSAGTVYKAYYDNALTSKYVRDPESVEMMQIILSTLSVDLGDTIWFENLRFPLTKAFLDKKGDIGIASTFKVYERPAKREIDKVMKFLEQQGS